jgi:uncharacterized protein (TIGR03067 family)
MKRLTAAAAVVMLFGANGPSQEQSQGDKDKLQGTWQVVSAVRMGRPLPEAERHKLVFEGDTLMIQRGDDVLFKGKVKLDPAKKPKSLDMELLEDAGGQKKGQVSLGIYVIEGDTLKWCNAAPGAEDRPQEFSSNDKKNHRQEESHADCGQASEEVTGLAAGSRTAVAQARQGSQRDSASR